MLFLPHQGKPYPLPLAPFQPVPPTPATVTVTVTARATEVEVLQEVGRAEITLPESGTKDVQGINRMGGFTGEAGSPPVASPLPSTHDPWGIKGSLKWRSRTSTGR